MYLHCASELLSKLHHMTNTSKIPTEGLNHYTMVYGLNSSKLRDKAAAYQRTQWKTIEDCFSNIHTFVAGYERDKGYCTADLMPQKHQ